MKYPMKKSEEQYFKRRKSKYLMYVIYITLGTVSLSVHVIIKDSTKVQEIKDMIKSVLKRDFNIIHTIIEVDRSLEAFGDI
jgi:hypothetical protein